MRLHDRRSHASRCSLDVHGIVIVILGYECIGLNVGATFRLAAPKEDADWIGANLYIC